MLGIAAAAAGAPDKISDDCTQRAGTEHASEDWMYASSVVTGAPFAGFTCL